MVFDMECICLPLLLVWKHSEIEFLPIFGYELYAVPTSLVDEFSCLRKRNKLILVQKLAVKQQLNWTLNVVVIDSLKAQLATFSAKRNPRL